MKRMWHKFRNACGWYGGRPGPWIVTNFLWNTLPLPNSKRYIVQKRLHDTLMPIFNPERLPHEVMATVGEDDSC